ncbi:M3 family oligoendopeptidase [Phototrophicus methaneseepsis]|uniref:M3 family oligoendopeptidase n=1 Tax=Phototrophicus methaneseepsis TaxID=2710758 RepID=A0A7S8ECC3_9CHLR|nr:M3 family oligoendopeptidase [Phototrophicus methaneseepsis]QPC84324.1 M3 family oligoendopeptidase [Phototrophicus methaneseepsis]
MFDNLAAKLNDALDWQWGDFEPYIEDLLAREVNAETVEPWMRDWSSFSKLWGEVSSRLRVATTVDTTDEEAAQRYKNLMSNIYPKVEEKSFLLNQKLVESGLVPEGMAIPMRRIKAEIALFREENLPLFVQESDLGLAYNKVVGAQTVEWEGEERTITQMAPVFLEKDRERRKEAWLLIQNRLREDRETINDLWLQFMDLRKRIATNAGFDTYRDYIWQDKGRFDYTPEQVLQFTAAIEEVAVPAMERLNNADRDLLGLETLRPWDTDIDPQGREPLMPFDSIEAFQQRAESIFMQVDPELGQQFRTMRTENLLDLGNRKGKGPGGYCTGFPISKRPFIFQNAVGLDRDIRTLLHESGHAFHGFARYELPYAQQMQSPMEFNEVASMAMELLASPYITEDNGGFYNESDAARSRIDHLKKIISFWPYMAVVVEFQHWIYSHHDEATDPASCDAKWLELWGRFMKGVDFSGYEDFILNRWRRQLHIFRYPFYYIEYGLAQLGAVQVWANALQDQAKALQQYRDALALGATVTLPQLYEVAGGRLAFDAETLKTYIDLIEKTIGELETA